MLSSGITQGCGGMEASRYECGGSVEGVWKEALGHWAMEGAASKKDTSQRPPISTTNCQQTCATRATQPSEDPQLEVRTMSFTATGIPPCSNPRYTMPSCVWAGGQSAGHSTLMDTVA